jgi:integrase
MLAGSFLEHVSVSNGVSVDYGNRLDALKDYVKQNGLAFEKDRDIEDATVEFSNGLNLQGRPASDGEKAVAALVFSQPRLSRSGGQALARVWKCLRGWRKIVPPRSRDPEAFEVWATIMYVLAGMNEYGMALMVAIGLNCYFRPGEALEIKVEDIIQPTRREAGPMSIIIFPKERQRASKTGYMDNSCLLDCTWMTWLPFAISAYLAETGKTHGYLFEFNYPQFSSAFMTACRRLNIKDVVPYQWRHSGASIDRQKNRGP